MTPCGPVSLKAYGTVPDGDVVPDDNIADAACLRLSRLPQVDILRLLPPQLDLNYRYGKVQARTDRGSVVLDTYAIILGSSASM